MLKVIPKITKYNPVRWASLPEQNLNPSKLVCLKDFFDKMLIRPTMTKGKPIMLNCFIFIEKTIATMINPIKTTMLIK